ATAAPTAAVRASARSVISVLGQHVSQLGCQAASRRLHHVEDAGEPFVAAALRVWNLRTCGSRGVERAEQPDPGRQGRAACGHPLKTAQVAGVDGDEQVKPLEPVRIDLPGPVPRDVVASPDKLSPGPSVHPLAQVPVPGARAFHAHPTGEARSLQFGPDQRLRRRRATDVAKAYNAKLIYSQRTLLGWQGQR